MEIVDYSGEWVGEFQGTNFGRAFIELKQDGNRVQGTARISEPQYGQYEYAIHGSIAQPIKLRLTVKKNVANIILGSILVLLTPQSDGSLHGTYESTIGGQGVFTARRPFADSVSQKETSQHKANNVNKTKVFIVHGHDGGLRDKVARVVDKLGLQPIILCEQPSAGKTVMEKLEEHTDVEYGIVLYTSCDVGAPKAVRDNLQPRARQNVVLEHGYLMGKLKRSKVCALVEQGVETPSDIAGVVYIKIDADDAWHLKLAKELRAAGFHIDMNLL